LIKKKIYPNFTTYWLPFNKLKIMSEFSYNNWKRLKLFQLYVKTVLRWHTSWISERQIFFLSGLYKEQFHHILGFKEKGFWYINQSTLWLDLV
jgi:hypothetical protein